MDGSPETFVAAIWTAHRVVAGMQPAAAQRTCTAIAATTSHHQLENMP